MTTYSLYSWNVNGIRAAQKKGFLEWLQTAKPDMLGIQETKAWPEQLDEGLLSPAGYTTHWATAEKKGYSGCGLFSRHKPRDVQIGLGIPEFDREGRTIVATYDDFTFITAYFPNGSRDHHRVPYKMAYKRAFLEFCNQRRAAGERIVFCGDINTANNEIDLARPKQNRNKTTGFLDIERVWFQEAADAGYVDSFRHLNPDLEGAYSWWSYIGNTRARNVGWRLDYVFVSEDLLPHIEAVAIHPDVMGSDHCPVSLTLTFE